MKSKEKITVLVYMYKSVGANNIVEQINTAKPERIFLQFPNSITNLQFYVNIG